MKKLYRKFFHILATTPFVILTFFIDTYLDRGVFIALAVFLIILILVVETFRLRNKEIGAKILTEYGYLFKKGERKKMIASIWSAVDLLLLALFFSRPTVIFSHFIGGYCDPLASIIGMKYGGTKNRLGKTWAGTAAFFISALVFIIALNYFLTVGLNIFWLIFLAVAAASVERWVSFLDDNFIVPMSFAVLMELIYFLG